MSQLDQHPDTDERELQGAFRQRLVENDLEVLSNSVISTSSSSAGLIQDARSRPELQSINEIGVGLQGPCLSKWESA